MFCENAIIRAIIFDIDLGNIFLDMTLNAQATEEKLYFVGQYQTEKLFYSKKKKNSQQNEKSAYRMGKRICKSCI